MCDKLKTNLVARKMKRELHACIHVNGHNMGHKTLKSVCLDGIFKSNRIMAHKNLLTPGHEQGHQREGGTGPTVRLCAVGYK